MWVQEFNKTTIENIFAGVELETFNIRDIVMYETYVNEKLYIPYPFYFNAIVSCRANGLIFIQYDDTAKALSPLSNKPYFYVTTVIEMNDIGRIFTEKSYLLNIDEFRFFVSSASPPVVYQFLVDRTMNVNIEREYRVESHDSERYIGNREVTVNADYIAMLLLDADTEKQVVRLFYRKETNFGVGHTHVPLINFTTFISSLTFLGYENCDTFYVRNSVRWETYKISHNQLIINTHKYKKAFNARVNNTYRLTVSAKTEFDHEILIRTQTFKIHFSPNDDMSTYLVSHQPRLKTSYFYGDSQFQSLVNNFYSGPNKYFGLSTNDTLR